MSARRTVPSVPATARRIAPVSRLAAVLAAAASLAACGGGATSSPAPAFVPGCPGVPGVRGAADFCFETAATSTTWPGLLTGARATAQVWGRAADGSAYEVYAPGAPGDEVDSTDTTVATVAPGTCDGCFEVRGVAPGTTTLRVVSGGAEIDEIPLVVADAAKVEVIGAAGGLPALIAPPASLALWQGTSFALPVVPVDARGALLVADARLLGLSSTGPMTARVAQVATLGAGPDLPTVVLSGTPGRASLTLSYPGASVTLPVTIAGPADLTDLAVIEAPVADDNGWCGSPACVQVGVSPQAGGDDVYGLGCTWTFSDASIHAQALPESGLYGLYDGPGAYYDFSGAAGAHTATCTLPNGLSHTFDVTL